MEIMFIERVQRAINYIEDRLHEEIQIEDVAKAAFMSQSSLYSIFKSLIGTTVKEYIRKRRLSLSAYDLVFTDMRILDIAIKFQYSSYEAYSRAFKIIYKISPKKYRALGIYRNIYPRVTLSYKYIKGGSYMINKNINSDFLIKEDQKFTNGYILSIDIDGFENINIKYGYSIGDRVLQEIPERIIAVIDCYQIPAEITHIANDEFAVIVKDPACTYIEELTQDIINVMSSEFNYNNVSFNISVSIGISQFTLDHDDEDLVKKAQRAMLIAKERGKNRYVLLD